MFIKFISFLVHAVAIFAMIALGCATFATAILASVPGGDHSIAFPILSGILFAAAYIGLALWRRYLRRRMMRPSALERAFADYDGEEDDEEDEDFEPGSIEDFHALLAQNGTRFCCCLCEKWQPRRKGVALIYEKTRGGLELSGALCSDCAVTYIPNQHEVMAEIRR